MSYRGQFWLTIGLITAFHILNMLLHHWLLSCTGYVLAGLLWILHPMLPERTENTRQNRNIIRLAGGVLILLGVAVHFRFV